MVVIALNRPQLVDIPVVVLFAQRETTAVREWTVAIAVRALMAAHVYQHKLNPVINAHVHVPGRVRHA